MITAIAMALLFTGAPDQKLFRLHNSIQVRNLRSDRDEHSVSGDTDGDGLRDAEERLIRTDPENPDTDGDALLDGWEVFPVNGTNLRALGASPLHKDIFVEMDFMVKAGASNGLGPNQVVLSGITSAFERAPVSNPDGRTGVSIHLVLGNQVPYDDDLNPYQQEFNALKRVHFDANRAPFFHYMIWANGYGGGSSSGISMQIPHSDFIVSLGRWNGGQGGTDSQKIGTFIHELGHNLGLMHGGRDHVHRKPNHLSVMNYSFQMRGVLINGQRVFDYQRFELPALNEQQLISGDGIGRLAQLAGYSTIIVPYPGASREVSCHEYIDWNNNGVVDQSSVGTDLNGDSLLQVLAKTPNEWSGLVFNGGVIGRLTEVSGLLEEAEDLSAPQPFVELTEEMERLFAPSNVP